MLGLLPFQVLASLDQVLDSCVPDDGAISYSVRNSVRACEWGARIVVRGGTV